MKTSSVFLSTTFCLCAIFLAHSAAISADDSNSASMDMYVEAEIPELIQLGGLPETVNLKVLGDGSVQSKLLPFYVLRNGANVENGKAFLLTVDSKEGKKNKRYFLNNQEAAQKMYIHVGLGDNTAATVDDLEKIPVDGIMGETYASLDSSEPTHTLALFNNDINYIYSRAPGAYSASFTVTVQAK